MKSYTPLNISLIISSSDNDNDHYTVSLPYSTGGNFDIFDSFMVRQSTPSNILKCYNITGT